MSYYVVYVVFFIFRIFYQHVRVHEHVRVHQHVRDRQHVHVVHLAQQRDLSDAAQCLSRSDAFERMLYTEGVAECFVKGFTHCQPNKQ